jgi:bifunctional DNA-binding transcriptional regulator/antitoxin component of YhaV-PrlF toxin-antitoxin module
MTPDESVIDSRGRVFLPASARAHLGIATDDRIVQLADPNQDLLPVHTTQAVAALLVARRGCQNNNDVQSKWTRCRSLTTP